MMVPAGQGGDGLRRIIRAARRITVLSGAGLSTECGVPDFRSKDSPWRVHTPIAFQDFLSDPARQAEAWRRKFAMDDLYADAKPGRGHYALKRLDDAGVLHAIVTQNIDGLQQDTGLAPDRVIELHGNGRFARCLACGRRHDLAPIRAVFERIGSVPPCGCGGLVKSATIAFGQAIPPDDLLLAVEAARSCDLFVVVGSSLRVRPASRLPDLARQNGAALAIVNRDPTPLDSIADIVVRDDIGAALELV